MKVKKTVLSVTLAAALAVSFTGTSMGGLTAVAFDGSGGMTYPYTTGADAFRYAPTFTMPTAEEAAAYNAANANGHWEFVQVSTDAATADLTSADYVAVQLRVDAGNPNLTAGLLSGNNRYIAHGGAAGAEGNSTVYFVGENGEVETRETVFDAIPFKSGDCGMLLMPLDQMIWQWEGTKTLETVSAWYFTANTLYNSGYVMTIGSVGYYKGDPSDGGTYTSIVDTSKAEREKSKYYTDSIVGSYCMEMPSDKEAPEPEYPEFTAYPFRTGEYAFDNAGTWTGTAKGDEEDNWQTLSVSFDRETVDLSDASYLMIQYRADKGAPGLTFGLQAGTGRYDTCTDGKEILFLDAGKKASYLVGSVLYHSVNVAAGKTGSLVIPMDSLALNFGEFNIEAVEKLILTTNSKYNWDFAVTIGEIGYYTGIPGEKGSAYTKILTLTSAQNDKFVVTSDKADNRGTLSFGTVDREMLGDVTIDVTGTGKAASDFSIWDGGSYGTVEMVEDSYGDSAMKLTATGNNAAGDAYTAITLSDGANFSWAERKGVSFWAKNDSDTEVSFNLETDCKVNGVSDRFNIQQGYRYYLYDLNTGKTTIYMTRPTATLPVGFEGWVWIPFTSFARASWSNNGITEMMGAGSTVSYLAVTIHAATYLNKSFSVNKFGGYSTTPSFVSSYVSGTTIPELLALSD